MKRALYILAAIAIYGAPVVAQIKPTPEQRITILEARLAASREEHMTAIARNEELGAIIRLERDASELALKKASECSQPVDK